MPFPANPSVGDTYVENNNTYKYLGPTNGWYRTEVRPSNDTDYRTGDGYIGSDLDVNGDVTIDGDIVLDDGGTFTTTVQTVTPTANRTISFPDATGTVALVAGSSGQPVYNNAGAYAGLSTATIGTTGNITLSLNGAASTPPVSFTGTWFTGGTSTTNKPHFLIEPTGTTSTAWSTSGTGLGVNAASGFAGRLFDFQVNGTSRAVLDSAGRLLVGTSSNRNGTLVQVEGTTGAAGSTLIRNSNDALGPELILGKTRSTSVGGVATVVNNDSFGSLLWVGADDTDANTIGAKIEALADGAVSGNDLPTRLVFSTTSDASASPTERFRITNDGVRGYNQPAPAAVDTTATLTVANLKTGIITSSTAAAVTMTLPTGTLTEGGFSGLYNNFTFEWTVINTGATNAVTVQGGTDHTLVGSGTVAAGVSGRFASRRTAANTFVTYRLS